jgi:hypothetical protein
LGVIARTSVMQYKHNTKPLDQIGRELGIQYTLEGSVRRDSDKRRITAQLIQLKDQTHLWTRQYDREPSNPLTLQGEIAQEIADEIQLKIGGHERIRPTKQAALSESGRGLQALSQRPLLLEQENEAGLAAGNRVLSAGDR